MNIGKVVRRERIRLGFKQKELGEKLGVTGYYVSLVENNRREPSLLFMRKLAEVTGVAAPLLLFSSFDVIDLPGSFNRLMWQKGDFDTIVRSLERIMYNMMAYNIVNYEDSQG